MRKILKTSSTLAFGSFLVLAGCGSDGTVTPPDPDPDPDPSAVDISGSITADATWSGAVNLVGETIIEPGVTVTIEAGTDFRGAQAATLRVNGSLVVAGTSAEPVTMIPLGDAASWAGIAVESGGELSLTYAEGHDVATLVDCKTGAVNCKLESVTFNKMGYALITQAPSSINHSTLTDMSNGGISPRAGSDLSITDSYVFTSSGDLIVMQAGSRLTIDQSEVGGALGSYEHCNFHINGADYLKITNSNIISGVYGFMLGGTDSAVITYNNFMENEIDISEIGSNTNVDLRYNYWANGAPNLGANYDVTSPAGAVIDAAGPSF